MKKKILIIVGVICVLVAGVVYTIYTLQQSSQSPVEYKDGKVVLNTNTGEVLTNDFYKNPVSALSYNGVQLASNDLYVISFYPTDDVFNISLLDPDLQKAQNAAEKELVRALGITQQQACALKVSMGVPYRVDPERAGQDIPLSFCR